MAARIREETGLVSELVEGHGGIFDVVVDGERVFSKTEARRFPEARDVIASIRKRRPSR